MADLDMYGEKVADSCAMIRKVSGKDYYNAFAGSVEDTLELFVACMDQVRAEVLASLPGAMPAKEGNAKEPAPNLNDWNVQMVGVQALLNCTEGELECIGEKLIDGYIEDVKRVYVAISTIAANNLTEKKG